MPSGARQSLSHADLGSRADGRAVHVVALDRPERGNALDRASVERLHAALDAAEADTRCVALVITANGRAFCAGADVAESSQLIEQPAELLAAFDTARAVMQRLGETHLVTVAVVQGLAAAGGLELVSACDVVVAARSAVFADRHARHGFVPSFGATARLPRRMHRSAAAWLLLTDGQMTASEAHSAGLVSTVVDDDHLADEVAALIDRVSSLDPVALATIKRLLRDPDETHAATLEAAAVASHLAAGGYRVTAPPRT